MPVPPAHEASNRSPGARTRQATALLLFLPANPSSRPANVIASNKFTKEKTIGGLPFGGTAGTSEDLATVVMVRVDDAVDDPGVTDAGDRVQVEPEGAPEHVN